MPICSFYSDVKIHFALHSFSISLDGHTHLGSNHNPECSRKCAVYGVLPSAKRPSIVAVPYLTAVRLAGNRSLIAAVHN